MDKEDDIAGAFLVPQLRIASSDLPRREILRPASKSAIFERVEWSGVSKGDVYRALAESNDYLARYAFASRGLPTQSKFEDGLDRLISATRALNKQICSLDHTLITRLLLAQYGGNPRRALELYEADLCKRVAAIKDTIARTAKTGGKPEGKLSSWLVWNLAGLWPGENVSWGRGKLPATRKRTSKDASRVFVLSVLEYAKRDARTLGDRYSRIVAFRLPSPATIYRALQWKTDPFARQPAENRSGGRPRAEMITTQDLESLDKRTSLLMKFSARGRAGKIAGVGGKDQMGS